MIEIALRLGLPRFTLDLAVTLPAGVTAVMGPSGSGKTSLLEAVAGLRRRARGRVALDGRELQDSERKLWLPPERREMGYVPQDAGLFPHLTVLGNLRFGARCKAAELDALVDVLEIGHALARRPGSLSGGEKQRVALARALATRPRLLLLDEPLAALDVELRERIVPYLLRIRDGWGVPILYVTHNVGEAVALAGDVLLLRNGGVDAQGPPLALLSSPALVRGAEPGIENVWPAKVLGHDPEGGVSRFELAGGLVVSAPLGEARPAGSAVTLIVRAEDVLVAVEAVEGVSARNLYPARIVAVERAGADVTLRCTLDGGVPEWLVRLTPAAVAALGLRPGSAVWLAVKSHSVRVI